MAADLSTWDTSSATTMRSMFNEATSFTGGLTNWKVDRVIDFTEMYVNIYHNDAGYQVLIHFLPVHCFNRFEEATSFVGDPALSSWNVSSAWFMASMV